MKSEVEIAREATASVLGEDGDVSYITQELLEEIADAQPTEVMASLAGWQENGNTITRGADGKWYWRLECSVKDWRVWAGGIKTERVINCTNGFLRYKITNA